MGCTLSLKNPDQSNPHIFKVFNVDDSGQDRNPGKLEVTEQALILHQKGKEPVGWPLKGLRRYGFDADLFSFESGRRCPTGPGIYAFRCQQAEALFNLLQGYITLAGHVDQQRRMFGPHERFDQMTARPDSSHRNFAPVLSLVGSRQNGHMPLSEYRNMTTMPVMNPTFGQPVSPRITLARLPDILAMSQQRNVDPVIHYADLDLSSRPGEEDQDVFPEEDAMEASGATSGNHSVGTSASSLRCYVNVPVSSVASEWETGRRAVHSDSIPVHSYANLDLISSSANTPVSRVNYIQLDLAMFNESTEGAPCQSPIGSPISPSTFHPESPLSQKDSYTTIDFDRTRALNAISIDNSGDEGLRKTRHNSNIEMLTMN